eukprot:2300334-Prymnesium_polylepis.1
MCIRDRGGEGGEAEDEEEDEDEEDGKEDEAAKGAKAKDAAADGKPKRKLSKKAQEREWLETNFLRVEQSKSGSV